MDLILARPREKTRPTVEQLGREAAENELRDAATGLLNATTRVERAIRDARPHNISVRRIHDLTGIARTRVDIILATEA